MTFVDSPQFRYDVFISYSRLDNRDIYGGRPWVTTIGAMLREQIQARTGAGIVSFFDESSDENLGAASFAENVTSSAILIPVITPTYLTRPYCELEWNSFVTDRRGTGNIIGVQPFPLPSNNESSVRKVAFCQMEKVFPIQFFDHLDDRPEIFPFSSRKFRTKFSLFRDRVIRKLNELKSTNGDYVA